MEPFNGGFSEGHFFQGKFCLCGNCNVNFACDKNVLQLMELGGKAEDIRCQRRPSVNVEDCQCSANPQATFTFRGTKLSPGVPPKHHVKSDGKVINTSIMNHLEKKELLSAHQFGFRLGLSTLDLLTSLSHQWLPCISAGGAVRVLAVDIAHAFDKVSHVGVLHKLRVCGIDGTLHRWLSSYLSNRNLQAVVGRATSQAFPVTADVPQGSILCPTLFIVYVNDAPDVLPADTVPAT